MAAASATFVAWAFAYDTAGLEQRSYVAHAKWLAAQAIPVLKLNSSEPVEALARAVTSAAARVSGRCVTDFPCRRRDRVGT